MSHPPVTPTDIVMATDKDANMTKLKFFIHKGFPGTKSELQPSIQPYWRVRDMLTEYDGIIYMGDRIVIPDMIKGRVLSSLHSAHQGTTSMRLRAETLQMCVPLVHLVTLHSQANQQSLPSLMCHLSTPSNISAPTTSPWLGTTSA